jgi:putative oxidoreductase
MKRYLGRFSEPAYAALRVVAGLLFAVHGAQKLFGVLGGQPPPVLSQFWIGGVIELVGGLLVAVGLFASWAAFVASGEMAVAYFQVHAPKSFWPVQNGGELAVVYCFLFLYVACRGAGKFAVKPD